jgi:hypothetical protein
MILKLTIEVDTLKGHEVRLTGPTHDLRLCRKMLQAGLKMIDNEKEVQAAKKILLANGAQGIALTH